MKKSALQIARAAYRPQLPNVLDGPVKVKEGEPTVSAGDQDSFPTPMASLRLFLRKPAQPLSPSLSMSA